MCFIRVRVLIVFLFICMVTKAGAEEIVATILFEPRIPFSGRYAYSLNTTGNKVADKITEIGYSSVGDAIAVLPDYLVKGAKIVYENKGMKNEVGEFVLPERFIAIITEDGTYIRLDELVSRRDIGLHFEYLWNLLEREKKQGQGH